MESFFCVISTLQLTITFSFKSDISRLLSIRLSSTVDNGRFRSRDRAGRCRQIRIWLHRAGRARSQKREMKFDRSDREHLALLVIRSQPRELQNGVGTLVPRGGRTFGVPYGHRRAPSSLARVVPLFTPRHPTLSRRTPFYTILFYLLPPCRCRHRRRRLCSLGGIR